MLSRKTSQKMNYGQTHQQYHNGFEIQGKRLWQVEAIIEIGGKLMNDKRLISLLQLSTIRQHIDADYHPPHKKPEGLLVVGRLEKFDNNPTV